MQVIPVQWNHFSRHFINIFLLSVIWTYLYPLGVDGICVWQGGGGFRLACGFKQSGLFRLRSLGGLKGWAGAGFTIGDEDGFKDSLTNKESSGRVLQNNAGQRPQPLPQYNFNPNSPQHAQQNAQLLQLQQLQRRRLQASPQQTRFPHLQQSLRPNPQQSLQPQPHDPEFLQTHDPEFLQTHDPKLLQPHHNPGEDLNIQKRSSLWNSWKWPSIIKKKPPAPPPPARMGPIHPGFGYPNPRIPPKVLPVAHHPTQQKYWPNSYPLNVNFGHPIPLKTFPINLQREQLAAQILKLAAAERDSVVPNFAPMPLGEHLVTAESTDIQSQIEPVLKALRASADAAKRKRKDKKPYGLELLENSANYGKKFKISEHSVPSSAGVDENTGDDDMTVTGYDTNLFPDIYFTSTTPRNRNRIQKILEAESRDEQPANEEDEPTTEAILRKLKLKKIKLIKKNKSNGTKKGEYTKSTTERQPKTTTKKLTTTSKATTTTTQTTTTTTTTTTTPPSTTTTPKTTTTTQPPTTTTSQISDRPLPPLPHRFRPTYRPDYADSFYHDYESQPSHIYEDWRHFSTSNPSPSPRPSHITISTNPLITSGRWKEIYDPRYSPEHEINQGKLAVLAAALTTTSQRPYPHYEDMIPNSSDFIRHRYEYNDPTRTRHDWTLNDHQSPSVPRLPSKVKIDGGNGQFVQFDSRESLNLVNRTKSYNDAFYTHFNKSAIEMSGDEPSPTPFHYFSAFSNQVPPGKTNPSYEKWIWDGTPSPLGHFSRNEYIQSTTEDPPFPRFQKPTLPERWAGVGGSDIRDSSSRSIEDFRPRLDHSAETGDLVRQKTMSFLASNGEPGRGLWNSRGQEIGHPNFVTGDSLKNPSKSEFVENQTPSTPNHVTVAPSFNDWKRYVGHIGNEIISLATSPPTTSSILSSTASPPTTSTSIQDIRNTQALSLIGQENPPREFKDSNSTASGKNQTKKPFPVVKKSKTSTKEKGQTNSKVKEVTLISETSPPSSTNPNHGRKKGSTNQDEENDRDDESDENESNENDLELTDLGKQMKSKAKQGKHPKKPAAAAFLPVSSPASQPQRFLSPTPPMRMEPPSRPTKETIVPNQSLGPPQPPVDFALSHLNDGVPSAGVILTDWNKHPLPTTATTSSPPLLVASTEPAMLPSPDLISAAAQYSEHRVSPLPALFANPQPLDLMEHLSYANNPQMEPNSHDPSIHESQFSLSNGRGNLPSTEIQPPVIDNSPAIPFSNDFGSMDPPGENPSEIEHEIPMGPPHQLGFPSPTVASRAGMPPPFGYPMQSGPTGKPMPPFGYPPPPGYRPSIPYPPPRQFSQPYPPPSPPKPMRHMIPGRPSPSFASPMSMTEFGGPPLPNRSQYPGPPPSGRFPPPHGGPMRPGQLVNMSPPPAPPPQIIPTSFTTLTTFSPTKNLPDVNPSPKNEKDVILKALQTLTQANAHLLHSVVNEKYGGQMAGIVKVKPEVAAQLKLNITSTTPIPTTTTTEATTTQRTTTSRAAVTPTAVATVTALTRVLFDDIPSKFAPLVNYVKSLKVPHYENDKVQIEYFNLDSVEKGPKIEPIILEPTTTKKTPEVLGLNIDDLALLASANQPVRVESADTLKFQEMLRQAIEVKKSEAQLTTTTTTTPIPVINHPALVDTLTQMGVIQKLRERNMSGDQLDTLRKLIHLNKLEERVDLAPAPPPFFNNFGHILGHLQQPPPPPLNSIHHRISHAEQSINLDKKLPIRFLPFPIPQPSSTTPTPFNSLYSNMNGPTMQALKILALNKFQNVQPSIQIQLPQQTAPEEDDSNGESVTVDLSPLLSLGSPETTKRTARKIGNVRNSPKSYYPGDRILPFDEKAEVFSDFECDKQEFFPGLYGDAQNSCKVFHLCAKTETGILTKTFRCPQGTGFDQEILRCNWGLYVNCQGVESKYSFNKYLSQSFQFLKNVGEFSASMKSIGG